MTKRSAMLMAAGLVMALLGGSVALSFGLSGGTTATADMRTRPEPIVRTITRTVRVEKDAKPADRPVQVITLGSTSSQSAPSDDSMQTQSDDDTYEDDAHEDDEYEDDDSYEDEDHEDEDHEEDEGEIEDD